MSICKAAYDKNNKEIHFPEQNFRVYHCYGAYGLEPGSTGGRVVKTVTIDSLEIQQAVSFAETIRDNNYLILPRPRS